MKIEQIYTGCLAQGAYYIESNGEVAIIDPLREITPYIERLTQHNHTLKYIFETHFHADFVSGHVSLAAKTGAQIIYGPNADTQFEAYNAQDLEVFQVGDCTIQAIHTPGHTLESTCYLLKDAEGNSKALFSGDTLFIGDVGRPDLAQQGLTMTKEDLAGILYDSLRQKVMKLDPSTIIYPAHGAGSACGKKMSSETSDTLGNQLETNYALRADMTKEEFIAEVLDGLGDPPGYFSANVRLNQEGYEDVDTLLSQSNDNYLSPDQFEELANQEHPLMLDVRTVEEFSTAHIPNSIFVGLSGPFAPWVGELIVDVQTSILLITNSKEQYEEARIRLSRVGFDNVLGTLEGGIDAWVATGKEVASLENISPEEFMGAYQGKNILDVRSDSEFSISAMPTAKHIALNKLNLQMDQLSKEDTTYLYCGSGYRSVISCSILKSRGYHNLINVQGGFGALSKLMQ